MDDKSSCLTCGNRNIINAHYAGNTNRPKDQLRQICAYHHVKIDWNLDKSFCEKWEAR